MLRKWKSLLMPAAVLAIIALGRFSFFSETGYGPSGGLLSRTALAANTKATGWGTLKGRFLYDGTPPAAKFLSTGGKDGAVCDKHKIPDESLVVDANTGGLRYVVVFARKTSRVHESYREAEKADVVFDQKECVFLTHVLPVRIGQTLVIKNSDPIGHNSNVSPPGDASANPLLAPGADLRHVFKRQQNAPVTVSCNIHPWMKAYVLPRNDPYVAVSDAEGRFEIANLPAGEPIELQVWHERANGILGGLEAKKEWAKGRFTMTLKDGEAVDLGDIKVAAALLK